MIARILVALAALAAVPAAAQEYNGPSWRATPVPSVGMTGMGVLTANNITVDAASMSGSDVTLTITKSKSCRLVVLDDTSDRLVIGCRVPLGK